MYCFILLIALATQRRRQWHPTPVLLPGKSHGGAWWAAAHGVAKRQTWLSDFTFTFHFHALEKEMATHSSILAWRIPGTAEPGGLPSMGVAQKQTRLKWLSSSSSSSYSKIIFNDWGKKAGNLDLHYIYSISDNLLSIVNILNTHTLILKKMSFFRNLMSWPCIS